MEIQAATEGRPVRKAVRDLIWRVSRENPLWGAPGTHGELLMPRE